MISKKDYLKYAILKILDERTMHGYKMTKELEKRLKWSPSPGSLYPILNELEEQKFIIGHDFIESHKFKKVYKITVSGKEELKRWRKKFREFITFMGFS